MLTKGDKVIGLNVVTVDDGKVLHTVKDIVFDPKENKIRGVLVDEGGWFSDAKFIFIEDIKSIGKDAVMVQNISVVKKASELHGKVSHIIQDDNYLTKTKVITEDGTQLG